MTASEVVGRQHPKRDDRDSDFVTPTHEFLELVCPGLVTGDQRLARSVGARPPAIPVSQHGDVAWQTIRVELGNQPMLIGRIEESRRMQPIDELAHAVQTCHNWQRIPPHL
jgi:hypothetical protein